MSNFPKNEQKYQRSTVAGIIQQANALRALDALGVADETMRRGSPYGKVKMCTPTGFAFAEICVQLIKNFLRGSLAQTPGHAPQFRAASAKVFQPPIQRVHFRPGSYHFPNHTLP